MDNDPFIVRNYAPGDEPYIMSTWLRDLRYTDYSSMPSDIWFDAYRKYIERILQCARVEVAVLAAADEPSEIIGYAVAIPDEVLFWVQIRKGQLRRKGLAKRLLTQVKCSPNIPLAFQTVDSKNYLLNPPRPRLLRTVLGLPQ